MIEVALEEYVVGEDREVIIKAEWDKTQIPWKRDFTKDTKTTVEKGSKMRRISFMIDGKNYGVAFDNIPPIEVVGDLYPCVELWKKGDSVELV